MRKFNVTETSNGQIMIYDPYEYDFKTAGEIEEFIEHLKSVVKEARTEQSRRTRMRNLPI